MRDGIANRMCSETFGHAQRNAAVMLLSAGRFATGWRPVGIRVVPFRLSRGAFSSHRGDEKNVCCSAVPSRFA
jgi:hypothetical protein